MAPSPNSTSIYFCPKVRTSYCRLIRQTDFFKETISQPVKFSDMDTSSYPLYISASIAEEQNELSSIINGLQIKPNGSFLQFKCKFILKNRFLGDEMQMISNEPIKPGTSWSININYGDRAGNNNVSLFFLNLE